MRLIDIFKSMLGEKGTDLDSQPGFNMTADSDGVNFYQEKATFANVLRGEGTVLQKVQLVVLRMLEEQGIALPIANGFHVVSEDVAGMDEEQADMLRLPRHSSPQ